MKNANFQHEHLNQDDVETWEILSSTPYYGIRPMVFEPIPESPFIDKKLYKVTLMLDAIEIASLAVSTPIVYHENHHRVFYKGDSRIISNRLWRNFWAVSCRTAGFPELADEAYRLPTESFINPNSWLR